MQRVLHSAFNYATLMTHLSCLAMENKSYFNYFSDCYVVIYII